MKRKNKSHKKVWAFLTLLGFTQVVLKLTDTITWNWWEVLLPFWIAPAIFLLAMSSGLVVLSLKTLFK